MAHSALDSTFDFNVLAKLFISAKSALGSDVGASVDICCALLTYNRTAIARHPVKVALKMLQSPRRFRKGYCKAQDIEMTKI